VVKRVKSPYPSTSDPKYGAALQEQIKDLLGSADDALFGLVDRTVLDAVASLEPELIEPRDRAKMERALDLAVWIDLYRPQIIV
jgi:asparagine synthase (glutamine-hydrolysing)